MSKLDEMWLEHALEREGEVLKVYKDSLGKLTYGIGHLLTAAELKTYKLGDLITKEHSRLTFKKDSLKAKNAAQAQAEEIGITEDWFVLALISVNFQMGVKWIVKFKNTYAAIVAHDFDTAINNLRGSLWYKQTPVRVEDFIAALKRAKSLKERPLHSTRTMQGAGLAGTAIVSGDVVSEITAQIEPLVGYSETIKLLFLVLALVGIGITVYARICDRKKGLR